MNKIEFSGRFVSSDHVLGYQGITVPKEVMTQIKKLDNQRFIIHLNEDIVYPGTPVSIGKDHYIILVNKARQKKLRYNIDQEINLTLVPDESEFGMPMPEEFKEVMSEDPEGEAYLRALTPGKIRSLIYLVAKVKNPDKRIEKSVVIFEHLRANKGIIDFPMLNIAFKEYNKL